MSRTRFVLLSLFMDALFVNGGIVGAFALRFGGRLPEFNFSAYVALAPVLTVVYLGTFYVYGLYEPERTETPWEVARAALQAVAIGTILTAAISFFAGFFAFSRFVILIAAVLHFALITGWRIGILRFTPVRWPEQRVLVVGLTDLGIDLARELDRRAKWGYRVVGALTVPGDETATHAADAVGGLGILGSIEDLPRVVAEHDVHRVILASPAALRELVEDLALSEESDVRIEVVPELYEIFIGQVDSVVSDIPLMQLTRSPVPSWFTTTKRLGDVVFALFLLVVTSPFVLLGMLGILVTMGRPVFYTQERVGKDLERFRLVKLRTMVREAEEKSGPVLAAEADPRVTRLGRVLRKYRVDELPQLFNIIAGDMSFVGPRPERAHFVERHLRDIPGYRERFKVKPGATGLAQVSGGYATTAERKLKYDLIYMYHQSLLLDLQILARTVRVVLTGRGAR